MGGKALRYPLASDEGSAPGFAMDCLVEGGVYDIRRVAAGPGQRHGPAQYPGDACVVVLEGDVRFTVDGADHLLAVHDMLWVPPGAFRGFAAGERGVVLLAIHVPRRR